MRHRHIKRFATAAIIVLAGGWAAERSVISPASVRAQQSSAPAGDAQAPSAPSGAAPVIRAESKVVRVDVIVTDKKGNYVHDLTAKDFHVFDNNHEEAVVNFSYGSSSGAPGTADRHYMVLFFDDSTMEMGDQLRARDSAKKFIDANAGPDRVMAVVDFTGSLRIIQNFTADAIRLKQAASSLKASAVSPNAEDPSLNNTFMPANYGGAGLPNAEADFGVHTLLLGIRSLAMNLRDVPGRKSVVLFTAGFPLDLESDAELTATISACNQANVAVYPLDVRGLVAPTPMAPTGPATQLRRDDGIVVPAFVADSRSSGNSASAQPRIILASYPLPAAAEPAEPAQKGGGGGGGGHGGGGVGGGGGSPGGGSPGGGGGGKGGGAPGGGSPGGGRPGGGAPGTIGTMGTNPAYPGGVAPQMIMPSIPDTGVANQSVMYALAEGTGGFPILNSNDLLGGLTKIAHEQDEYYLLGYDPPDSPDGSCHALRVKMDRGGLQVRARSGYCTAKPKDMLAGKPGEKDLEARANAADKGSMGTGSLTAPFFYTSPNEARVNVAMEIPSTSVDFSKEKGKYHAAMQILGIAYRPDGTIGARFSDEVSYDLEKDEWKQFTQKPVQYSNQFQIAPGTYRLDVVLSAGGQNFGKYETRLAIDPYDGKTFSIGGLALSNQFTQAQGLGAAVEADLLSDRTPLIVNNVEVVPSASNHFKKTDTVAIYTQLYDPHLTDPNPPTVKLAFNIVDAKTGQIVLGGNNIDTASFIRKGNTVVPVGLKIPIDRLQPGSYRLDVQASDASGSLSKIRSITFDAQ